MKTTMRVPMILASRYFVARRQRSVVHIISRVALVGIAVCAFAFIVVLSVYNGIGQLTQGLFNVFDPEIVVQAAKGKSFHTAEIDYAAIERLPQIATMTQIVEEKAWVTHGQRQAIVELRGVEESYAAQTGIDTLIYEGSYLDFGRGVGEEAEERLPTIVLGGEIYYRLNLTARRRDAIGVHIPRRGTTSVGYSIEQAFNTRYAEVAGCFYLQQEIDSRYALIPIEEMRALLGYAEDEVTSIAIALRDKEQPRKVKREVQKIVGADYVVRDRLDQQPLYYKIYRSERLAIYFILALVTLISTFTLVASITLLIIDKKQEIATLRSIGMTRKQIRSTFALYGSLIAGVGAVIGIGVGALLCALQQRYGLIAMGDNFVTRSFPVAMRGIDFAATLVIVLIISSISIHIAVRRIEK